MVLPDYIIHTNIILDLLIININLISYHLTLNMALHN